MPPSVGDFERQQAKIVDAINTIDADVVSLEEIENSIKVGETDRDSAVRQLVAALNADAGTRRWAFVPLAGGLGAPARRRRRTSSAPRSSTTPRS